MKDSKRNGGKELFDLPGQVLGNGFPDWPEDLSTFAERKAYQRGIAHARAVDASSEDRPCAAATPLSGVYAEHMAKARWLGFANVTSALAGLERRLAAGEREAATLALLNELLAVEDLTAGVAQLDHACEHGRAMQLQTELKRRRTALLAGARALVQQGPVAPPPRTVAKYGVGDEVTYTNQQGVVFPNKIIVEVDQTKFADGEPRYYIRPTDTPWVSFRESELTPSDALRVREPHRCGQPGTVEVQESRAAEDATARPARPRE